MTNRTRQGRGAVGESSPDVRTRRCVAPASDRDDRKTHPWRLSVTDSNRKFPLPIGTTLVPIVTAHPPNAPTTPELYCRVRRHCQPSSANSSLPPRRTMPRPTTSLPVLVAACLVSFALCSTAAAAELPNVVVILADDLGYGDASCYGATEVSTPNIDRLAAEGTRFTSGYCSASTCTPTRYSLLTGTYAFRHPGTGIAPPNSPALIPPGTTTLPSLLKRAGYRTAVIGKWHLG